MDGKPSTLTICDHINIVTGRIVDSITYGGCAHSQSRLPPPRCVEHPRPLVRSSSQVVWGTCTDTRLRAAASPNIFRGAAPHLLQLKQTLPPDPSLRFLHVRDRSGILGSGQTGYYGQGLGGHSNLKYHHSGAYDSRGVHAYMLQHPRVVLMTVGRPCLHAATTPSVP